MLFSYFSYDKVIIIQKHYRGYKCRRYINNIYKRLNCDIQYIIRYYINKKNTNIMFINKVLNNRLKYLNNKLVEEMLVYDLNYYYNNSRENILISCSNNILNNIKMIYITANLYVEYVYYIDKLSFLHTIKRRLLYIKYIIDTILYYNISHTNILDTNDVIILCDLYYGIKNMINISEC